MSDTDTHPTASVGIGKVAAAYGVTVPTVRAWANDGTLKSFRTEGGQRRFRLSENPNLAALLTSQPEEAAS